MKDATVMLSVSSAPCTLLAIGGEETTARPRPQRFHSLLREININQRVMSLQVVIKCYEKTEPDARRERNQGLAVVYMRGQEVLLWGCVFKMRSEGLVISLLTGLFPL